MNERWIGPAFLVTIASAIGFVAVYATGGNTQLEGICLFGVFGGLGTAVILWAKHIFPHEVAVEDRGSLSSPPEYIEKVAEQIEGTSTDVTRRRFLSRLGLGAAGSMGLALIVPLKSLGPNPGSALYHTEWEDNLRLVNTEGRPIRPTDLVEGSIVTVWPEGKERKEDSAVLLIKVSNEFKPRPGREDWAPQFNVAYSKICTHVGCPVGLYRKKTEQLLCPCHQSTFDVLDGARPVFGPAARALPQLPLKVNSDGFLAARHDFLEPIGAGFWDRDKHKTKLSNS